MSKYQSQAYRSYVLVFLTLIYALNFIDRQLIVILQESIKADLNLSDTQLGLLTGFAFAMFYVLAGIPIARIADRSNRRNVIAYSVGLWSLMTAVSGYANNFVQMLLARIGVGVGEAGCSPPAHSMISDMYPQQKRATALSFYSIGINIGIMLGFLMGGVLNQYFGWRMAFVVVGLPGILVALMFRFMVAEPIRGATEQAVSQQSNHSITDVLSLIVQHKYLIHLAIAAGLSGLAGYALSNWTAPYFVRFHAIPTAELGVWLAFGAGVLGSIGTFGWGFLADKLGRSDYRWYMWIPAIVILLPIPFLFGVVYSESSRQALIFGLFPALFTTCYLGAVLAVFHRAVEVNMRATASALFFLVLNLIGLGLGPVSVGALSDYLLPTYGQESLKYAMIIVIPIACVWASLHFFLAAKSYRK